MVIQDLICGRIAAGDKYNFIKFRIDICQAGTDDERKNVIAQLREYMPDIQKREKLSEKNGYHVKRGSLWTEKNACTIGDIYWFILKDDDMAIRYYELSIELVNYWLGLSEKVKDSKYKDAKPKASYAHYMLTRIYGELGNKKKCRSMQTHIWIISGNIIRMMTPSL